MEAIKIIIQKTIEPIKIIVYNFPRVFPIQIRWENIFDAYAKAIIKLKTIIGWSLIFATTAKAKLKSRAIIQHGVLVDIYARTKSKMKIKSEHHPIFDTKTTAIAKLKSSFSHSAIINATINARSLIFKKWQEYPDTIKWKDLDDDLTNEEFMFIEIL